MTGGNTHTQPPERESGDVALFIDWDNIKGSDEEPGPAPDIQALKKACRRYGRLAVSKAYANWQDARHRGDAEALDNQGIEPVFVATRADAGTGQVIKNSADVRMAVDCVCEALGNPKLTAVVLVTGDRDFLHVVTRLRALGKRVAVIARSKSVAYPMTYVPDDFRLYEELVSGFAGVAKGETAERIAEALKVLDRCVREIDHEGRDNTLADAKIAVRERIPDFQEEDLGFSGFAYFAFMAERRGMVRVDATRQPPRIYPGNRATTREGKPLFSYEQWLWLIEWMKAKAGPQFRKDIEAAVTEKNLVDKRATPNDFVQTAIESRVLRRQSEQRYNPNREDKWYWHHDLHLDEFNARVQVYLGTAAGSAEQARASKGAEAASLVRR